MVDVLTPIEYAEWRIPGAVNIPLGDLHPRLDEIPTDKPVFVHCRVGFRGYLAYRILAQSGFEHASNLAGGVLTFTPLAKPGIRSWPTRRISLQRRR